MSKPDVRESPFNGVRVLYDSARSYDRLLADLLADIGERPVPIDDIAKKFHGWESYEQEVQSHFGPSGFMLFGLVNHGGWISKAGIHDVTAGLFSPVEVLLLDEGEGLSSLIYVKPSSLMVVENNPELLSAAEKLDATLAALAAKVTTVDETAGVGERRG